VVDGSILDAYSQAVEHGVDFAGRLNLWRLGCG
jgi:hypothetical protein